MERLADCGEAGLLRRLFPVFAAAPPDGIRTSTTDDVRVGPGDDAAVVAAPSGSVVVTTDSMVRDLDWRDDWSSAEDVGWKVVGQNVADIAAMGARPTSLVVALAADPLTSVDWCVALATGIAAAAARYGVTVVGGDLSAASPGVVVVTVTALGDLDGRPPVLRSGARPGDVVAVCGTLGRSGTGLELLRRGAGGMTERHGEVAACVLEAHRRAPVRHLVAGPRASGRATAMLDISDGLVRDLDRIATASDVHVDLDRSALEPYVDALAAVAGEDAAWEQVLGGGEEHALVATFPPDLARDGFTDDDPVVRWTRIGAVQASSTEPGDDRPQISLDGVRLGWTGWDHFAR
ncbi:MAG: thiamine-phosphate kinase [Dermatophilaceae bacterium]